MRRTLSIGILITLMACMAASDDTTTRRSFLVRLFDYADAKPVIAALRDAGFRVDVTHQKDAPKTFAECTVIAIGSDVPAADAAEAIRLAHKAVPTLKYVFIREDPERASVLFLGTYPEWIDDKQLKPLTDKDFAALGEGEMTQAAFHARVRRFGL